MTRPDFPVVIPHDGGMNSRTWWVTDHDGSRWLAKWVPDGALVSLAAGTRAADLAAATGVPTGRAGRPVAAWDGGELALLEIVPGTPLADTADDQRRIGATLAAVHTATAGHVVPGALDWHWVDPAHPDLAVDPALRAAVGSAVDAVAALPSLVTGVCHGDPAPEAFLADGPTTGLIDWGSPVNGPLLFDVASAAMYLGGLDAARPMIEAYAAARGPATPDLDHLAVMLRLRWAVQADYYAHRIATGDLTGLDSADGNLKGLADARVALLG